MDRAEWLAARRRGIGGSDVAAILGLSPWRSPADVYADKLGVLPETEPSEPMRWGSRLEEAVAEEYERRNNVSLIQLAGPLSHPEHPWAIGTPDRLVNGQHVVVEIKTTRSARGWGEPGSDQVPDYYLVQCQWYLGLLPEYARCDVAVLIAGQEYREYTVARDDGLIEVLLDKCGAWWQRHIVERVPPPMDGGAGSRALLRTLFPRERHAELRAVAPADEAAIWRLRDARRALDQAEAEYEAAANAVRALIGEAAGVQGDGYRITWKRVADARVTDWQALARQLGATPEQIAQHTTLREGVRRLLARWDDDR